MHTTQPIKLNATERVIGYFYRYCEDGRVQYVTFASTVEAIEADKVTLATREELEATWARQRAKGQRG